MASDSTVDHSRPRPAAGLNTELSVIEKLELSSASLWVVVALLPALLNGPINHSWDMNSLSLIEVFCYEGPNTLGSS